MSGEHLGKVRRRLEEATEMIEAADQKIVDCRHATLEAKARCEKLEVELQSAQRRIVLITKDLTLANERLGLSDGKLGTATSSSEEVEVERETLENDELTTEENIEKLEDSNKEMKRNQELNSGKVVEAERKVEVCNNDVAKIRERAEISEARVKALEDIIDGHGKSAAELEEREGEMSEREELNEEKINFLESELKETTVRAEAAERMTAVHQNNIMESETEINRWVKMREDMEKSMLTMDDIADDPAYLCFTTGEQEDSRPSSVNAISSMFGAKGEESGSRSGSRAGNDEAEQNNNDEDTSPREQTPMPVVNVEPELESPPEPEPEAEDSDDGWD